MFSKQTATKIRTNIRQKDIENKKKEQPGDYAKTTLNAGFYSYTSF